MKLALLMLVAIPVYAQAPTTPPILISGEERQAVLDLIDRLTTANEGLARSLKNCRSAQQS